MSTEDPQAMTPNQIIAAWRQFDYVFPEAAFRAASVHEPAVVQRLLVEVDEMADWPDLLETFSYWSSLFSLYVLAWHREARVLQPLRRLLDKTGADLFDLWGDSVGEDAPRLFASWAYSDPGALRPIIELRARKHDVFRSSALEAYILLYHAGAVTEDFIRPYLRHLADSVLRKQAGSRDGWLWYAWGRCCVDMGLEDLYPEVEQAYEREWVDPMISRWEEWDKLIRVGRKAVLTRSRRDHGGLIEEPVAELGGWYCFTEAARLEDARRRRGGEDTVAPETPGNASFHSPNTIVNEAPKPGANKPCPCGSGKKYKKCCGR